MPRNALTPFPQPIFNEGSVSLDPTRFKIAHGSDTALYKQIQTLLKKEVVSFDASRAAPDDLYALQAALGPAGKDAVQQIKTNGQIVFHAAGDSGASNAGKYGNELRVADQLTADYHVADAAERPAFFYHLGDVVYNFGESQYYYDQFYEPYRNYPAPIFAIPGNHDSFVVPNTPADETPLTIFARNFCAEQPVITQEAGSLHRTAMTQPGVYFTLDAPFVRIIGLFSNALEDPGVISSEGGKWPTVPDTQLEYLTAQLKRVKKENYSGALLLATHHPPFSYAPPPKAPGAGGNHSSSTDMLREIDAACKAQGVYPHAFLAGHAHNYQRFMRTLRFGGQDIDVPFLVCGDSGHNVNPIVRGRKGQTPQQPRFDSDVSYLDVKPAVQGKALILKHYDGFNYGYLRVTVDKSSLQIGFHQVGAGSSAQSRVDLVTIDLATHTVLPN